MHHAVAATAEPTAVTMPDLDVCPGDSDLTILDLFSVTDFKFLAATIHSVLSTTFTSTFHTLSVGDLFFWFLITGQAHYV